MIERPLDQRSTGVHLGRVVLTADADRPGQQGASALARRMAASGIGVRVVTLPDNAKDLRAWKQLPDSNAHALAALIEAPVGRMEAIQ